ncbi:hypothetical protein TNIN_671 [Trichonephila inaurata madagascariensis]|uniref:Uncharacterized protein n=1 Tax=Trichonephila inaurata madagascariensis TaxID=2747483 RepID=A0A8X6X079_9ARAC|nr:hypothetical protein TNIN_671 [Trichonephila inaurata madagascariensis]
MKSSDAQCSKTRMLHEDISLLSKCWVNKCLKEQLSGGATDHMMSETTFRLPHLCRITEIRARHVILNLHAEFNVTYQQEMDLTFLSETFYPSVISVMPNEELIRKFRMLDDYLLTAPEYAETGMKTCEEHI